MSREYVLHKVRTALGRTAGQGIADPPPVRLSVPEVDQDTRLRSFLERVEALAGKTRRASTLEEVRSYVDSVVKGRPTAVSGAPLLRECGIAGGASPAQAAVGITSADYALADTGTLVTLASQEARLVSLLPPVHIAVVPADRVLSGLDELFTLLPHPAAQASSMVLITGPSRTADIEQILVRGVHGPGELHVVLLCHVS